jgi:hypothetical protein
MKRETVRVAAQGPKWADSAHTGWILAWAAVATARLVGRWSHRGLVARWLEPLEGLNRAWQPRRPRLGSGHTIGRRIALLLAPGGEGHRVAHNVCPTFTYLPDLRVGPTGGLVNGRRAREPAGELRVPGGGLRVPGVGLGSREVKR